MERATQGRSTPSPSPADDSTLLARLGLDDGASNREVEAAYADVSDYLRSAPAALRSWAALRLDEVDEAYALLNDPDRPSVTNTPGTATRPGTAARAAAPAAGGTTDAAGSAEASPRRRTLVTALAVVAVASLAVAVYLMGRAPAVPGIEGAPTDSASTATATQPDPARVSQLMQQISADPKDVAALLELGDLYFASGDYATAATWAEQVVAIEPDNATALLALGAAEFNQGDVAAAEGRWLKVVELQPDMAEAHYDLGFLYLSQDPPDMGKVRQEWDQVVAIDPDSDIAQTVSSHLDSLDSPASPAAQPEAAPATGE